MRVQRHSYITEASFVLFHFYNISQITIYFIVVMNQNENKRKYDGVENESDTNLNPATRRIIQEQQTEYERIQQGQKDAPSQAHFRTVASFKPTPVYTLTQCFHDLEENSPSHEDWSWLDKIEAAHLDSSQSNGKENATCKLTDSPKKPPGKASNRNCSASSSNLPPTTPQSCRVKLGPVVTDKKEKELTTPLDARVSLRHVDGVESPTRDHEDYIEQLPLVVNRDDLCAACGGNGSLCHYKMFGKYCTEVVDMAFREHPADTTRKSCVTAFTKAYNRSLDFRFFQMNTKLMPKAFYFIPSCLKDQLEHDILDVQQEQEDHLTGKQDFERPVMAETAKSEANTTTGTSNDKDVCEDCHCDKRNCHKELFDEYCCDHVLCQLRLYPTAMTRKEAIRVFVKKYNSALHFWRFTEHCILTKKPFEIPPPCLERGMYSCADLVEKSHTMWISPDIDEQDQGNIYPNTNRCIDDDFKEWRESSMDFDGLEMDDF